MVKMDLKGLKSVKKASIEGRTVFCRLDFDVPLDEEGRILDNRRIRICLPTINYLLDAGAQKIILAWKLGRPKQNEDRLKTDETAVRASKMLDQDIEKIDGWSKEQVEQTDARLVALENLRFHPGEQASLEADKRKFASQLAELADLYVNEAFACSHRKDSSIYFLPQYLPSFLGLNVKKELNTIRQLKEPQRPFVAVLGGNKQEKLSAVDKLLGHVDQILVGGVAANTLLQAKGYDLQESVIINDKLSRAERIVEKVRSNPQGDIDTDLILPHDLIATDENREDVQQVAVDQIPDSYQALDLGEETIADFRRHLESAAVIVWSGVVGKFELEAFEQGTRALADSIANSSAFTVAGGGETSLALNEFDCCQQLDFVSSGGGAFLQLLTGKSLPGLQAISRRSKNES